MTTPERLLVYEHEQEAQTRARLESLGADAGPSIGHMSSPVPSPPQPYPPDTAPVAVLVLETPPEVPPQPSPHEHGSGGHDSVAPTSHEHGSGGHDSVDPGFVHPEHMSGDNISSCDEDDSGCIVAPGIPLHMADEKQDESKKIMVRTLSPEISNLRKQLHLQPDPENPHTTKKVAKSHTEWEETLHKMKRQIQPEAAPVIDISEVDQEVVTKSLLKLIGKNLQLSTAYRRLGFFSLFFVIFVTNVFHQRNPYLSNTVEVGLINTFVSTLPTIPFYDKTEYVQWISDSVTDTVFVDPRCGDGKCEAPEEFAAVGTLGCSVDCGFVDQLTTVTVWLEQTPADINAMQTTSTGSLVFEYMMAYDLAWEQGDGAPQTSESWVPDPLTIDEDGEELEEGETEASWVSTSYQVADGTYYFIQNPEGLDEELIQDATGRLKVFDNADVYAKDFVSGCLDFMCFADCGSYFMVASTAVSGSPESGSGPPIRRRVEDYPGGRKVLLPLTEEQKKSDWRFNGDPRGDEYHKRRLQTAGTSGTGPSGTGTSGTGPSGTGTSGTGTSGTGTSGTGPSGTGPSGTGPSDTTTADSGDGTTTEAVAGADRVFSVTFDGDLEDWTKNYTAKVEAFLWAIDNALPLGNETDIGLVAQGMMTEAFPLEDISMYVWFEDTDSTVSADMFGEFETLLRDDAEFVTAWSVLEYEEGNVLLPSLLSRNSIVESVEAFMEYRKMDVTAACRVGDTACETCYASCSKQFSMLNVDEAYGYETFDSCLEATLGTSITLWTSDFYGGDETTFGDVLFMPAGIIVMEDPLEANTTSYTTLSEWNECSMRSLVYGTDDCDAWKTGWSFSVLEYHDSEREIEIPPNPNNSDKARYGSPFNAIQTAVVINQERRNSPDSVDGQCDTRFKEFYPSTSCSVQRDNKESFGVDPMFVTSSSMYSRGRNAEDFYDVDDEALWTPSGIPYGFHYHEPLGAYPGGFPVFLDTRCSGARVNEILSILEEGSYFDEHTDAVELFFVMYNGNNYMFSLLEMKTTFSVGGSTSTSYSVDSIRLEQFLDSSDTGYFVLELLFYLGVAYVVFSETKEAVETTRYEGITAYIGNPFNWIDTLAIVFFIIGIVYRIAFLVRASKVEIEPHYKVLADVQASANILKMDEEGVTAFFGMITDLKDVVALADTQHILNGVNLFFMLVRMLKLVSFQARMGILTRTLGMATVDLIHFSVLFFMVVFGYAAMGHVLFGRQLAEFETVAMSIRTTFVIIITGNGDGVIDKLVPVVPEAVAAVYYWSYIVLVFFILMNVFLAIVIDAFTEVKSEAQESTTLPEEVSKMFSKRAREYGGRVRQLFTGKERTRMTEQELFGALNATLPPEKRLHKPDADGDSEGEEAEPKMFLSDELVVDKLGLKQLLADLKFAEGWQLKKTAKELLQEKKQTMRRLASRGSLGDLSESDVTPRSAPEGAVDYDFLADYLFQRFSESRDQDENLQEKVRMLKLEAIIQQKQAFDSLRKEIETMREEFGSVVREELIAMKKSAGLLQAKVHREEEPASEGDKQEHDSPRATPSLNGPPLGELRVPLSWRSGSHRDSDVSSVNISDDNDDENAPSRPRAPRFIQHSDRQ